MSMTNTVVPFFDVLRSIDAFYETIPLFYNPMLIS